MSKMPKWTEDWTEIISYCNKGTYMCNFGRNLQDVIGILGFVSYFGVCSYSGIYKWLLTL